MESRKKGINKRNLVLSIVIAFAMWIFVVYNVNPTMTRTFKDVPITLLNENVLRENGMAVKSMDVDSIDITVRAKRRVLDDIQSGQIKVNADVADAGKGDNPISLSVVIPNDAIVKKQSVKRVNISVEDLVKKKVDAKAVFVDGSNDHTEPSALSQSDSQVTVSGAKSLVGRVSYVRLSLDSKKVGDSARSFSVKPEAVDKNGKEIKFIKSSPGRISVKAVKAYTKKVALNVKVNNPDSTMYSRTYDAPSSVVIKGKKTDIKKITSIDTQTIDLSGITENTSVPISYVLPDGIEIANESMGLKLDVKIEGYPQKTIDIGGDSVKIVNVPDGSVATVNDGSIPVIVSSDRSNIDSITAADITVTVDAGNSGKGTYYLKPTIKTSSNVRHASLNVSGISITIS